MHFVYILYSEEYDKYYVGETQDFVVRLYSHNNSIHKSFTSKYRPWKAVALFEVHDRSTGRKCEIFIKKQKSKKFIIKLINDLQCNSDSILVQMVRVPIPRE